MGGTPPYVPLPSSCTNSQTHHAFTFLSGAGGTQWEV